jgi:hypothetical protein
VATTTYTVNGGTGAPHTAVITSDQLAGHTWPDGGFSSPDEIENKEIRIIVEVENVDAPTVADAAIGAIWVNFYESRSKRSGFQPGNVFRGT